MTIDTRPGRGRALLRLLAAAGLVATLAAGTAIAGDATPVVNVNTASIEELQALPGIGEARARAIVAARQELGGFENVDQLVEVRGIGPANLERLRPHARTAGKTRISADEQ